MAYSFTPLALPNILGAFLSFLMLYLLLVFTPHTRVMRILSVYVYFAAVTTLTWALITLSADPQTRLIWSLMNQLFMVTLFPLQIHFLLLYMGRAPWLVGRPWPPSVLYLPVLVHVLLMGQPRAFQLFFVFWAAALVAVLTISAQALRRERNPFIRAQKWLLLVFVLVPFVWLVLYTLAAPLLPFGIAWVSGYFIIFPAALAIYAMLRYHVLNADIVLRSGLAIFITSLILGCVVYSALFIISWLFGYSALREALLLTFFTVVFAVWFFKPLYESSTKIVEWLAPDLKWKECRLEHVFLMDYNGIRISSASRSGLRMDEDLAGGLLTAIQQFAVHTLRADGRENVRTINLRKHRILIEHAPPIYIALLYTGHEAPELRKDARTILRKVLERHGERLRSWDGNRAGMEDVDQMLERLVARAG